MIILSTKNFITRLMTIILSMLCIQSTHAQLTVIDSVDLLVWANKLAGPGVEVSNVTTNGCEQMRYGTFEDVHPWAFVDVEPMTFDSGIVMSTGRLDHLSNPASFTSTLTFPDRPFDPDLATLIDGAQRDICVIEFDFVPSGNEIRFRYVFGSEEYPDFNCSEYNDVFGFFISGPGIEGNNNIAIVPGTDIPVAINSINSGITTAPFDVSICHDMGAGSPFSEYYVDNIDAPANYIAFNGLTTQLTAKSSVVPCETYHLKLAIADINDRFLDSGVFLEAGSLTSTPIDISTLSGSGIVAPVTNVVRGCNPGSIVINIGYPLATATTFELEFEGTAINGVDVVAVPSTITLPAGETSMNISVEGIVLDEEVGMKTFVVKMNNPFSCGDSLVSDSFFIYDPILVNSLSEVEQVCLGNSVTLNLTTEGTYDIVWEPQPTLSTTPDGYEAVMTPLTTTTYFYEYNLPFSGCESQIDSIVVQVASIPEIELIDTISICAGDAIELVPTYISIPSPLTHTFTWSPSSYLSSTSSLSTIAEPSTSTLYSLLVNTGVPECEAVAEVLVIVNPVINTTIEQEICHGMSYLGYTVSGVYTTTYTASSGCDSIQTLFLNVLSTAHSTITEEICAGSSYMGYVSSGTFVDTFESESGCDSIRTLNLTVNPMISTTITEEICVGSSYMEYTSPGTFVDTFESETGCDSIRTLILTVLPVITTSVAESICDGGSYEGYTTTGIYTDIFPSILGCDSIRTLNLTVNPIVTTTITEDICAGSSYLGYSSSGTYIDTFDSETGCDSLRILNLTINPTVTTTITEEICAGSSYLGYSSTGTYIDTFDSETGCDSMRILNLTVNPIITTTITEEICAGSSYLGYSSSGMYIDTFDSETGCDSIRTLNLTVNPIITTTIYEEICAGSSYLGYSSSGTYIDTFDSESGCDSIRTLNLTVLPINTTTISESICEGGSFEGYSLTGIYTDIFTSVSGCDSVRILDLTVNPVFNNTVTSILCRNELPTTFMGIEVPVGASTTTSFATIDLTTITGCDSIITIDLIIHETSSFNIDTTLCHGTIYEWNGLIINASGNYQYTTSNFVGCDSLTNLNVTYLSEPVYEVLKLKGCGEVIYGDVHFTSSIQFIDTFRTSILNCDSVYRDVQIEVLEIINDSMYAEICSGHQYDFNGTIYTTSTTATQVYVNDNGCDSFITLVLDVNPLPEVMVTFEAENPALLCIGDTVVIVGQGADYYTYYDEFIDILEFQNNPIVRLSSEQNVVYVQGFNEYGCSETVSLTIVAEACCDIVVPNAFSPNGDGLNDQFGALAMGNPQNFVLQIFNRWGERIFQAYHPGEKWDGTFHGHSVESGVYFVLITALCSDGTPYNFKGEIHLLR